MLAISYFILAFHFEWIASTKPSRMTDAKPFSLNFFVCSNARGNERFCWRWSRSSLSFDFELSMSILIENCAYIALVIYINVYVYVFGWLFCCEFIFARGVHWKSLKHKNCNRNYFHSRRIYIILVVDERLNLVGGGVVSWKFLLALDIGRSASQHPDNKMKF